MMDNSLKQRFDRLIAITVSLILFGAVSYVLLNYLYPFFIAFIISMLLHPIVTWFERRWKLNRGVTTLFVIVTFFCVFLFSGYLLLKRITEELADLFVTVPTYTKNIATILQHIEESYLIPLYVYISNLIPIQMMEDQSLTQFFIQKIKTNATHLIQQAMIFLSQLLSSFAYTSLILLFIVLATYFMTKDFEKMIRILQENIPKKVKRFIINIKDSAKQSTFGLIKAQIMIALITVIMSFLGLSIFR